MRRAAVVALVGLSALVALSAPAVAKGPDEQAPRSDDEALMASMSHLTVTARSVEGQFEGAWFGLYVPDQWIGKLVVYAHGYADPSTPVDHDFLASFDYVRQMYTGLGW